MANTKPPAITAVRFGGEVVSGEPRRGDPSGGTPRIAPRGGR